MSDYIKREDAVLAIAACLRFTQPMATRILESVKSADVVEQKHGKWLYKGDRGGPNCLYICSVCNNEIRTYQPEAWNYCPNCGARMDGE